LIDAVSRPTQSDGVVVEPVWIGNRRVGPGLETFVVAEIGINHNGDVNLAKRLVEAAVSSGADAVKLQKRTVAIVYSDEELNRPRESPFGKTNRDLKLGLEFGPAEYSALASFCADIGVPWFASCWDEASVDFIEQFEPPCYKIASACLTDESLLEHTRVTGRPIILSTGMSSLEQIDRAVQVLGRTDLVLMHTTSTYPSALEELNLRVIPALERRHGVPVGYSGHEVGLAPTFAAVVLGACVVERHITVDRALWGSDQAASVEPQGFTRLVKDIRAWENARGDGEKRVYESERPVMEKLRRVE
jgi:N-acetylneuraminate synthase